MHREDITHFVMDCIHLLQIETLLLQHMVFTIANTGYWALPEISAITDLLRGWWLTLTTLSNTRIFQDVRSWVMQMAGYGGDFSSVLFSLTDILTGFIQINLYIFPGGCCQVVGFKIHLGSIILQRVLQPICYIQVGRSGCPEERCP